MFSAPWKEFGNELAYSNSSLIYNRFHVARRTFHRCSAKHFQLSFHFLDIELIVVCHCYGMGLLLKAMIMCFYNLHSIFSINVSSLLFSHRLRLSRSRRSVFRLPPFPLVLRHPHENKRDKYRKTSQTHSEI